MSPAWVLLIAWAALYVGLALGGWWVGRDKVPGAKFNAAMKKNKHDAELIRYGLRRENELYERLQASHRLLEQATKKRDPKAVDWSKIGV